MQYRSGLIDGLLARTGLDLTPFSNLLSALEKACAGRAFAQRRDAAIIAVFPVTGIRLAENGSSSPQMLRRYGASASSARARRTYDHHGRPALTTPAAATPASRRRPRPGQRLLAADGHERTSRRIARPAETSSATRPAAGH
jgi:hypothetical protein